jgi:hypothetical protein
MRCLGQQSSSATAIAVQSQLVPGNANPNPSGVEQKLRGVSLRHPRGFAYSPRPLPRWCRVTTAGERGLELSFETSELHPVGTLVELALPLRSGLRRVRGTVVGLRWGSGCQEIAIAIPVADAARVALLARICELEHRLHVADPAVRLAAGQRRLQEWRELRARVTRLPGLYAELVRCLWAGSARKAGGWTPANVAPRG